MKTSQLCPNFQASQAVHGVDDIAIPYFSSQVHSTCVCGPQVDTLLFTTAGSGANLCSIRCKVRLVGNPKKSEQTQVALNGPG